MRIGVVAECRPAQGPWSRWQWRPIAAIAGGAELVAGAVLREEGAVRHVFIGAGEVELVTAETAAYKLNLDTGSPSIYVVATPVDGDPGGLALRGVTASPWEAEAFLDGHHVVERVAMPEAAVQLLQDFVAAYHVEDVFMKRQRKRHDPQKGFGRGSSSNDYGPGTFEPTR
ncbi:MAG: DUF3305 domain-containing protein [Alphaproteobacteria bacterium]|nr:DUF3305 domain-containing protein [Alphaproteobacteria bacterium]